MWEWLRGLFGLTKSRKLGRADTATRMMLDAGFSGLCAPVRSSQVPCTSETAVNQIEELERILSAHEPRPKPFRLQFLDAPTACDPAILGESVLIAADIDTALWKTAALSLPPGVRVCRLASLDGGETAYRFMPDHRLERRGVASQAGRVYVSDNRL